MMTRETKIGLLVGLAFLLVVGILLSEHITGSSERPAAPLADAGKTVRTGMSAPGAAADEPKPAEPTAPVPTAQDLTPKPAPVTQVTINVPAGHAAPVVDHTPVAPTPAPVAPVAPVNPPTVVVPSPTVIVQNPTQTDPFANDPIRKLAEQAGEQIVPVDTKVDTKPTPVTPVSDKPTATAAREYKAQAGDTLSRLASQLPGGNVKANRDAVVALNPTLQKDPNKVLVGRTYLLPTVAAKPADKSTTTVVVVKTEEKKAVDPKPQPTKSETTLVEVKKPEAKPIDTATRIYVVKAGDTLSKIASNELGSKNELPAIRTLNADVLKGTDVIKVNMKLKLPAKAMASIR